MQAWHAAFERSGITGYDWRIERVGDALCSVSSSDPSILLNRVLGLGSERPPAEDQLRAIRDIYDDAGIERFFLHVVPAWKGEDTNSLLEATGYQKYRGWMKFVRGRGAVRAAKTDLEVRPVGPEYGEAFASIAAPAFDLLDVSHALVALLPSVQGQLTFMSFLTVTSLPARAPSSSTARRPLSTGARHIPTFVAVAARPRCWAGAFAMPSILAATRSARQPVRPCRATRSIPTATSSRTVSRRPTCARTGSRQAEPLAAGRGVEHPLTRLRLWIRECSTPRSGHGVGNVASAMHKAWWNR